MSWRRLISKIQWVFGRHKPTDELEEEIRAHLLMEELENRESGMPPDEAHYSALRRFGNVTNAQERSREMWLLRPVEILYQDVRYGLRQLRNNVGFTIVAVLTFALGIGATTAVFSIVHSVLLRPLPFQDPDRLVALFETEQAPGNYPLSGADYLDWQSQNRSLQGSALYSWPGTVSASGGSQPESAAVVRAQANFFDVLGVRPAMGRGFAPGEDTAAKNHVTVLSYGFWQRHFGGGDVLGKSLILDGEPYTVAGVMPRWFKYRLATDAWVPVDLSLKEVGPHGNHRWNAIARIKPGVTLGAARAELLTISERLEKQLPDSNRSVHAVLMPLSELLTGRSKTPLLVLLGAVTLVLLVACVNVTNLQLARASTRYREMSVRASLGAGRLRLVCQMVTESILLALAGAIAGILGAWWCVRVLQSVKSLPIPVENPIQIDGVVLLAAIGASFAAGVLFGLVPALQVSERALNEELRAGSQSVVSAARVRQFLRDGLVVAEISVTLALLVGAALLLRSFANLRNAELGVDIHKVVTTAINLPESRYPDLTARLGFFQELQNRLRSTPDIESTAVSSEIPLRGGSNGYIRVDGNTDPALARQLVGWNFITPDYFRTLSIPILSGRGLDEADISRSTSSSQTIADLYKAAQGHPFKVPPNTSFVAVISQTMAQRFWKNQNPIGRSFFWNDMTVTVVGIAGDVREYGIRAEAMPQAYLALPLQLGLGTDARLTVKSRIASTSVIEEMRKQVHAMDPDLALDRPQTMDEVVSNDTQDTSVQTVVLGSFAVLALVLAAVGLYGVTAYLVEQRTREIGIRMALGARRSSVLYFIMKRGTMLTLLGMLIGVCGGLALTRAMSSLLYGVTATDPLAFGLAAPLLGIVALIAYLIPARRATKIEPLLALRYE